MQGRYQHCLNVSSHELQMNAKACIEIANRHQQFSGAVGKKLQRNQMVNVTTKAFIIETNNVVSSIGT